MGKTTTAALFREMGCSVWDADAAVHRLYAKGGAAVSPIGELFPSAVIDGAVSRDRLKELISSDPEALKKIESVVHPLVRQDRAEFAQRATEDILVFDIPLLFETGSEDDFDAVACVTVPAEIQRKRVLERGTMTNEQFEAIRSKQMTNDEKCARSDFVIETVTLEKAQAQVQAIVRQIRSRHTDA